MLALRPLLALLAFRQLQATPPAPVVTIPRVAAEVRVDGRLDEPVWRQAARLSGFHQYQPVDGRPAEEVTEVLVWYSPTAIHFGIVAHARKPSTIRATLANRDNIGSDDRVTLYLDTFADRRRAFFFSVNPLGIQADGVRSEGAGTASSFLGGNIDYNPDFIFDSKGRVTDTGYEVEVRIPFKSLRYPAGNAQRWGLHVVRDVPATGYQDTWTDTRRAGASFLAQEGMLDGLHDLARGVVTEVQPFVTAMVSGARATPSGAFARGRPDPSAGANLRLGWSQLSLDATINPDFSQVESDAGLVTVNERFALFIPEKRPFFLEGIDLFSTPNQLVYTRRVGNPIAGAKVTGKIGPYAIAHLSAVDESAAGEPVAANALATVSRVRADFGENSNAGLTLTTHDRHGASNYVLAGDSRVLFARLYYAEAQLGGAWSRDSARGAGRVAPIWKAEFNRTGRSWGFNYSAVGVGDGFASRLGFVPRTGIVTAHAFNRLSYYGARGARLESITMFLGPTRVWAYGGLGQRAALEGNDNVNVTARLRGGWNVNGSIGRQFFAFDPATYARYAVQGVTTGREPFVPPAGTGGLLTRSLQVETPVYQTGNASVRVQQSRVPIFAEASEGRETRATVTANLRPTAALRLQGTGVLSRVRRARDGSEFARTVIPRLKGEYQVTRALFFRVVGEYRSERLAALIDERTGRPLLVAGTVAPATEHGGLRIDWLASYEPSPGTVAFLGYGSTHDSPFASGFDQFRRTADGLFVKLAYQFRR